MGMTNACDLMQTIDGFSCAGGVSNVVVSEAEAALGLSFSEDFREYLSRFGYAEYFAHELCGLGGPKRLDIVSTTFESRELNPQVPSELYVIEDLHIDGFLYWQGPDGTVYETVPGGNPRPVFPSLAAYVEETRL